MKTLYDVQEWLKDYGYVNLISNRLDAIYFMKQELAQMLIHGLFEKNDPHYLTALLILRREERIEKEKQEG